MFNDFLFKLSRKNKNSKFAYYAISFARQLIPGFVYRRKLNGKLAAIADINATYIHKRVNYYNKLENLSPLTHGTALSDFRLKKKNKVYFFDTFEFTRYFNPKLKINYLFGDITHVPNEPSIVKSRPIHGNNANSVVLNLDKVRHFMFVKDETPFEKKKDMLVGRSTVEQEHRIRFYEMYFGHPMCDLGKTKADGKLLHFMTSKMTIARHLDYKFILCLEGHDVASNLKWVMSSNSLAVMPPPKYETWFMEGTLIPDYHYVAIKADYSDLEEKLLYYIDHIDDALKIINNAHQYINQFRNKEQEDLISLLVLEKYFIKTGQVPGKKIGNEMLS